MTNYINKGNTAILILLIIILGSALAGCGKRGQNIGDEGATTVNRQEDNRVTASAEPSVSMNSLHENRAVDFNLLIKDKSEEVIVKKETIEGNLQFDNGSLTIINAGLKLPEDCSIEFLGTRGNIELEMASLKTAGLINANVEAGSGCELHLHGDDPLKNTKINMQGTDISLYLYSLHKEYVLSNILKSDIISFKGKRIEIPEGKDELINSSYKLEVVDFKKGSKVILKPLYSALSPN
ncbi:MAG: hypothetical protein ABFS32_05185 [Bacteroidota bacterium]